MSERIAPDGQVWVCLACGKTARDRFGLEPHANGWDESCMLNAALCYEDKLTRSEDGRRVVKVQDGGIVRDGEPESPRKPAPA
jgi:hypothetical protein